MDRALLRTVATKILDQTEQPLAQAALRFVEEAQITAQLEHPNIVPVHDIGIDEHGRYFFTMKIVNGKTLQHYLSETSGSDDHRTLHHKLQILVKVCDAIGFAHSQGVVHADLKPDNIMVGSFGQVYVMDWGIAQLLDCGRPSDGAGLGDFDRVRLESDSDRVIRSKGRIVGTLPYMSPEQALGMTGHIDQRTDVFALGGILYQMLTGHPPYTCNTTEEILAAARAGVINPPAVSAPGKVVLPGLAHIAMKALSAHPAERYQTVPEMQEEIERFLRGCDWFDTRTYLPGDIIMREGDDSHEAYIITSGLCEAFKTGADTNVTLRTMGPGDVFGETGIFTSQPRSASVRALAPLSVLVATRESLEKELGSGSSLSMFVKALGERFRERDEQLMHTYLATDPVQIACAILKFLCFNGENRDNAREGSWSVCLDCLTAEFGLRENELMPLVERSPHIRVDKVSDTVSVSNETRSAANQIMRRG